MINGKTSENRNLWQWPLRLLRCRPNAFEKKGLDFTDIPIVDNEDARAEMQRRSGASSVPQIFINDQPIGGFDELYELEESGDLDKLLGTCADVAGN